MRNYKTVNKAEKIIDSLTIDSFVVETFIAFSIQKSVKLLQQDMFNRSYSLF